MDATKGRLGQLNEQFGQTDVAQIKEVTVDGRKYNEVIDFQPFHKNKLDYFNKQGWGYKDSFFEIDRKNLVAKFTGNRYLYSGKTLPYMWDFIQTEINVNYENPKYPQEDMEIDEPRFVNHDFLQEMETLKCFSRRSFEKWERIMHSHGATVREVFSLRFGRFEKYVDVVVYPGSTDHVQKIIELANKYNVVIVPYGGGTNVTQALYLQNDEKTGNKRMVVSLDMSRMNKVLWVDKDNMIACVQAGIRGQDLERDLKISGVCSGHEPDSSEFSTLGGWISTRASGMKKNTYGNIEEIVKDITFITPTGTFMRSEHWPRVSAGPDFTQLIMGQEGNFGVVTEAIIRIRPVPEVSEFGSIVFPNFDIGIKFMEEMSKQKMYPSSLRLVDNLQFKFGQALRPAENSRAKALIDELKKQYLFKVKGFDQNQMCAATCLFEGPKDMVAIQSKQMYEIAKKYGGIAAGSTNGIKGYQLTYMIAYIRDICLENNIIAESFETSCPWSQVEPLCKNVKEAIFEAGAVHGMTRKDMFVSFRVTQLYETGAAVYVYFSMNFDNLPVEKTIDIYEDVEHRSREAVFKYGGCISHHHGVGKLRKRFMEKSVTELSHTMMKGVKSAVDPQNIFAINNTYYADEAERKADLEKEI